MPLARSFRPGARSCRDERDDRARYRRIRLDAVVTAYFRCDYFRRPTVARRAVVVDRYWLGSYTFRRWSVDLDWQSMAARKSWLGSVCARRCCSHRERRRTGHRCWGHGTPIGSAPAAGLGALPAALDCAGLRHGSLAHFRRGHTGRCRLARP